MFYDNSKVVLTPWETVRVYFRQIPKVVFVLWMKFAYTFAPHLAQKTVNAIKNDNSYELDVNRVRNFYGSFEFVRFFLKEDSLHMRCQAKAGEKAPNTRVIDLATKNEIDLLSLQRGDRPLVLNFGNCTWPPFMAKIRAFDSLVEKYAHLADFVVVYIEETHPVELAHVRANYEIPSHENLEQRLAAAQILKDEVNLKNCPIVADTMDDMTNILYGAMPERLYIVRDHKVEYQGNRGPFLYNLKEMEDKLVQLLEQSGAVIAKNNNKPEPADSV